MYFKKMILVIDTSYSCRSTSQNKTLNKHQNTIETIHETHNVSYTPDGLGTYAPQLS